MGLTVRGWDPQGVNGKRAEYGLCVEEVVRAMLTWSLISGLPLCSCGILGNGLSLWVLFPLQSREMFPTF